MVTPGVNTQRENDLYSVTVDGETFKSISPQSLFSLSFNFWYDLGLSEVFHCQGSGQVGLDYHMELPIHQ